MDSPAISVIIPVRDGAATLGATLHALAAQDLESAWEVIVVDDGSRDATVALAAGAGARVITATTAGAMGGGPARARNAGAAAALAPALAFTDADCVPAPGWLRAGLAALRDADLVQGRVAPDPAATRGPWDRTVTVSGLSGLYETANVFVAADLFARLGGFESWLGATTSKELGEDVWLGWRAVRSGARIAFASNALVHHTVFARGAGGYVAERARLRFFPALARRVPELRNDFFFRRVFLAERQARFDLAVVGGLVVLLTQAGAVRRRANRRRRHFGRGEAEMSPPWLVVGLMLSVPYAVAVARDARTRGPEVAAVEVAADAVSLAALGFGSVRARSLLI